MRCPQPRGNRGSLKWIQRAVAHRPDLLQPEGLSAISWLSPTADDDFAEYRDKAFLDLLGLGDHSTKLSEFWPMRGPQWDALGVCKAGPVLVEAKAHLGEFLTPSTQAGPESRNRIEIAFAQARMGIGAAGGADWCDRFYQYANRLAHLWWLHSHGVDAKLLLVGFVGDDDVGGPSTNEVWSAAYRLADYALGLPRRHILSQHVFHISPNVSALDQRA